MKQRRRKQSNIFVNRFNDHINRPKKPLFERRNNSIQIQLTTYGRQKADSLDDLSLRSQIMMILSDGPIKPAELKNKLEMRGIKASDAQIKNYVNELRRNGYVQIVRPNDGVPVGGV